jgi:hypothetical protein
MSYSLSHQNATPWRPSHVSITIKCAVEEINVKLSLCFNWAPRHWGVLGEWTYSSTRSLASALDGGEWSASRSGRFIPRERAPGTHWIRGWAGPRAVLDAVVKRKIPSPCRKSNPRTPIVQPVAQRYTDWAEEITLINSNLTFRAGITITSVVNDMLLSKVIHWTKWEEGYEKKY